MGSFIPATDQDRKEMLSAIGINSIEDLFGQLPKEVMLQDGLNLPRGMSEMEVSKKMEGIPGGNQPGDLTIHI